MRTAVIKRRMRTCYPFFLTLSYEILLLVRYDGDSTIGHRLYTEDVTVNFKQNWKGKGGRLTIPVTNIYWETVATNLDEFLEISVRTSAYLYLSALILLLLYLT